MLHWQYHIAVKVRAALVIQLAKKLLLLTTTRALESGGAVSLMSAEVDGIIEGIPHIHNIIAGLCEACYGAYLLTIFVNSAAWLAVGSIICEWRPLA